MKSLRSCYQPNILILDSAPPRALLADFGSAHVTTTPAKIPDEERGAAFFMAPELLSPTGFGLEKGLPSKKADIYALGMVVYQVLTGKLPFFPRREEEVILAVTLGEHPPKPENAEEIGMTEVVWDLLMECWRGDRTTRPTITRVWERFREITSKNEPDSTIRGSAVPPLSAHTHSPTPPQNSPLTVIPCKWAACACWSYRCQVTDEFDAALF